MKIFYFASLKENGSSLSCNRDRSEANSSPIKSDLVANAVSYTHLTLPTKA